MKDEVKLSIKKIFELATSIVRDINWFSTRVEIMGKSHLDARHVSQSYDDDWMVIVSASIENSNAVKLLISPALVKYNRAWDSDIEHMLVIQKAEVLYKNGVDFVGSDEYKRMKAERVLRDVGN
ncbi:hypothetical protein F4814DRAFT_412588 [Daldinia grandis]|nr:hypothetical protein F4814DRAFT_412588 [Daldinia grandis]